MSVSAINWAFGQPDLSPRNKLVLVALANHARPVECWPGWELIAQETGLSRASVFRAYHDLSQAGLLSEKTDEFGRAVMVLPVSQRDSAVSQRDSEPPAPSHAETTESHAETTESHAETPPYGRTVIEPLIEPEQQLSPPSQEGIQLEYPPGSDELTANTVADELFEAWRLSTGKKGNSQFTKKRKKELDGRIKEAVNGAGLEGARVELLEAVAGMANSSWHRANGHLKFEQLFRSRDAVEKFIEKWHEFHGGPGLPTDPTKPERSIYDTTIRNPELEPD